MPISFFFKKKEKKKKRKEKKTKNDPSWTWQELTADTVQIDGSDALIAPVSPETRTSYLIYIIFNIYI